MFALGLVSALLLVLAVACGDDEEEAAPAAPVAAPTAAPAAAPAPVTKAINVGLVADTDTLGPIFTGGFPDQTRYMLYADVATEIAAGDEFKYVPALLESWALVPNTGDTVWELKVRDNITTHNGEVFNAEDFVYNVNWHRDPENASAAGGQFRRFTSVEQVDDTTLRITTENPNPTFVGLWRNKYFFPKDYFEQVGADGYNKDPKGPGPFTVSSYRRDDKMVVEAFADYYGGAPKLDKMTLYTIPDPSTRMAAILSGDVDITAKPPPAELATLGKVKGIDLIGYQTPHAFFYIIDHRAEDLGDLRVRKAILHAIDWDAIDEGVAGGHYTSFDGLIWPGMPGHNPNLTPYEYNPEKSKQLIADAGFSSSKPKIKVWVPAGRYFQDSQQGEAVANFLSDAGFDAELMVQSWSQQLDCLYTDYGICPGGLFLMGGSHYSGDHMTYYRAYILQKQGDPQCQCPSDDGSAAMGLLHEGLENLAGQVRGTFDINKQAALLQQMEKIHWEELLVIKPITITPEFTLVRDHVDFVPRMTGYFYLKDAALK
jgi:peptide/nickel transport system substrate-binding protein